MSAKSTGSLHITCPHLGMKHDKATAFAYPSPGNYCYNCNIPTSPAEVHQEKYCLTTTRNECPVYAHGKSKHFPLDLAAEADISQNSSNLLRIFLWILLGLIIVIIIYNFISSYQHTGKIEIPRILLPQSISVVPTPTEMAVTKSLSFSEVIPTYTQYVFSAAPISAEITSTASFTNDQFQRMTPLQILMVLTTPQSPSAGKTQLLTQTKSLKPAPSKTQTRNSTITFTPKFALTASPKPTMTRTPQLHSLEKPFTVSNHQFIIHRITSEENYEILARTYNTKVEILLAINYQAPSPQLGKSTLSFLLGC
jgi:hypothetical protein